MVELIVISLAMLVSIVTGSIGYFVFTRDKKIDKIDSHNILLKKEIEELKTNLLSFDKNNVEKYNEIFERIEKLLNE